MKHIAKFNGHPLRFENDSASQKRARIVSEAEATQFDDAATARAMAKEYHVRPAALVEVVATALPPNVSLVTPENPYGLDARGIFTKPETLPISMPGDCTVFIKVAQITPGPWVNGHFVRWKLKADELVCMSLGEKYESRELAIAGAMIRVVEWLRDRKGTRAQRDVLLKQSRKITGD